MNELKIRLLSTSDMERYVSDYLKIDMQSLIHTKELQCLHQIIKDKFCKLDIDRNCKILGAFFGERLIGCVEIEKDEGTNSAELSIEVNEEFRQKGIGTALLNETINLCREEYYSSIELLVRDDNVAARKLYQKCGFVEICKIENISEMDSTKCFIRMRITL